MTRIGGMIWLTCFECDGEGGWWARHAGFPPPWIRCSQCYGFGIRSAAADAWFTARAS